MDPQGQEITVMGWVRSFRLTSAGAVGEHRTWDGVVFPGVVSFGRDGSGELYMTGGTQVRRLVRR